MTQGFSGSSGPHVSLQLAAYHNGTLSSDERWRVRMHLETCSLCRAESNDWSAIAIASRSVFGGFASRSTGINTNPLAFLSTSQPIQFDPPLLSSNLTAHSRKGETSTMSTQFAPAQGAHVPLRQRAFAPAALLVVVLAVAIAVVGLRPPGNSSPNRNSIPAAALLSESTPAPSTPDSAPEVAILSESCDVEPADLTRLDLTGATTYENAIPGSEGPTEGRAGIPADGLPTGEPASDEQIAEVTAAVQQLVDCIADGNATKLSAVFTDDYWRRMNALGMDYNSSNAKSYAPLVRPSATGIPLMPTIEDVVVLPDGRLAASLIPTIGTMSRESFDFYVFAEVDGNLLIDEAAHSYDRPELQLQVTDEGFSDTTLLVTASKTDLVLTNTGAVTHSIVIPALGVRTEVAPGESETVTLVYQEDTVPFYSDMPDDTGSNFSGTLTIDFPGATSPPVEATPIPVGASCEVTAAPESKLGLTGTPASGDALVRPGDSVAGTFTTIDESSIPTGSFVVPEQAAKIQNVVSELAECVNNGSAFQVASFFTDDYFRRLASAEVTIDPISATSLVPLQLNEDGVIPFLPEATDVIALADGRIGARVQVSGGQFLNFQYEYFVFANVDGRWLIDEAAFVGQINESKVVVNDDGFSPTRLEWTGEVTRLTVTNTGTREHSFISDELDYSIILAPGESQTTTFIPGANGTFFFTSQSEGDTGGDFSGTIVVTEVVESNVG
ncbi:hypothetical protein BH09CHL1_BH09CHL1_31810 [soil metagenome]